MKFAIAASLLVLGASAANAVTYYSLAGAPDPGALSNESIIEDFEGGSTGITYGGSYTIDNLTVSGVRAPPAGDTTNYFATPGTGAPLPGTATIDFGGYIDSNRALRSLSFYWGSVDAYNTLEVLDRDGNVLETILGSQVNNPANGDQSSPATNQRLFLRFSSTDNFGALRLTSTSRAFEIDDVGASVVPEPTTWTMLFSGFGLLGYAMRRRRTTTTVLN